MLTLVSVGFLFAAAFVFWVGVFVFSSNPFNRISRLGSILLIDLSCFLLIGYFVFSLSTQEEFRVVFKYGSFPLMFAPILWLHIGILLTREKVEGIWRFVIPLGYIFAISNQVLFSLSDLAVNFDELVGPVGRYAFIFKTGPIFFVSVTQIITYFSLALFVFYRGYLSQKNIEKLSQLIISFLFVLGWLIIILSYLFRYNPYFQETGEFIIAASVILLSTHVILNRIFFEGTKTNINREFIYSSISLSGIVLSFILLLLFFDVQVKNLFDSIFLALFIYLLLITHSLYDWMRSLIRSIFYEREFFLPRVTDEEVGLALKNLQRPEKLEKISLLRLNLLGKNEYEKLDKLREVLKQSIEYFKPVEIEGRTRAEIKYWILRLIGNQVEEGQILWDLGFEEYPLEIAEKADRQKPRLTIDRPTDYQATSRNAFISLKKEAIHDLAWRISYLEKHSK